MTENIKHNPPLICRDKLAVKLKEPVISNSHSCLDKVFYLNEFNTNYQCLLYGFFFPVVYILIDFLASRISSSSSFHKKGTQVLDILSYCLLKNVYLLLLYFLFEGILVEYFPFRTFELSVYCFRALIVLLCINLNSTCFFFYLLGCWFDTSFLSIVFWTATHK